MRSVKLIKLIAIVALACIASWNAATAAWSQEKAQSKEEVKSSRQFDIKRFVNKIDQNKNGYLEPGEMSDRTKGFVEKLGFDTSRPVKTALIIRNVQRAIVETQDEKRRKLLEANRKVPGFGIQVEEESPGVPGFGIEDTSESSKRRVADFSGASGNKSFEQLELEYGAEVVRQVRKVLAQYDGNRSGALEADEIHRAKWGRRAPAESDTNKDGKLTREELAIRYANLSTSASGNNGRHRDESERARSAAGRTSKSGGSDLKSRMERYREKVRAEAESKSADNSQDRHARSNRTSAKPYNAGAERYERYADALIRQYDKDKDGKLDQEEMKAMRRPPKGADVDGDGKVTRDELVDMISGKTSRQGTRSETRTESRSSTTRGRNASSRSNSRAMSFSENDTNRDGQLQMHEFAHEWNDELLREFKAKDKNGDGVITREEWNDRSP